MELVIDANWKWVNLDEEGSMECKGYIQFSIDGTLTWNKKEQKESYWKLKNNKKVLETKVNGVVHELKYNADKRKADVINTISKESHPSSIWGV